MMAVKDILREFPSEGWFRTTVHHSDIPSAYFTHIAALWLDGSHTQIVTQSLTLQTRSRIEYLIHRQIQVPNIWMFGT